MVLRKKRELFSIVSVAEQSNRARLDVKQNKSRNFRRSSCLFFAFCQNPSNSKYQDLNLHLNWPVDSFSVSKSNLKLNYVNTKDLIPQNLLHLLFTEFI